MFDHVDSNLEQKQAKLLTEKLPKVCFMLLVLLVDV